MSHTTKHTITNELSLAEKVSQAVLYIHEQSLLVGASTTSSAGLAVGVILGSGLGAFADQIEGATVIAYGDIPHFPVSHVEGHRGALVIGQLKGVSIAVMSGRVHYYEGYSMEEVTFPVRVLAGLGVDTLLVTNAAGGINKGFKPGDMMVITDHLNLTGDNPLRGTNDNQLGPRFPDMSVAYGAQEQGVLHAAAEANGITLCSGVYAGMAGPCYETPAEITMLGTLGADAVGMSTVAEVIVAKHAGLKVAGLSVITNYAAGLSDGVLSHDEVKEIAEQVKVKLCALLTSAAERLSGQSSDKK